MKTLSLSLSSRTLKNKAGFTLAELMIVIGVIGILAASLFPSLSSYLSRGRDTAKISEIKQLNTALISYQVDKATYNVPNTGANGTGTGWINLIGIFGATTYPKSIFTGLQELGYIPGGIKQKGVTDWLNDPVTYNVGFCNTSWPASINLYMFYYNDATGQYAVSGYLENAKQSDADNIMLSYHGSGADGTCIKHGRNYAVGQN